MSLVRIRKPALVVLYLLLALVILSLAPPSAVAAAMDPARAAPGGSISPSDVPFDQRVLDRIKAAALDIQARYQAATGGLTWEWAYPEIVRVYPSTMSVMSRTLVLEKAPHRVLLPSVANGAGPGQVGQILYTSARSWDQPHDVYVMNDDGTNVRRLTNGPGWSVDGRFSPDGTQIVFASERTGVWFVYTMSADGTNVKQLAPAMAWGECAADWSPDGRQIAYVCSTGGICVMNADGTNIRQLTSAYDRFPKWSHDGTRIAYDRFVGGLFTWNYDIFVMNADGSNQANMTNHPDTSDCMPDWSPDDSKITFTRWSTPDLEYVYMMNADGSCAHPITGDEYNSHSVWSPDGARIAFHSGQAGMLKNVFVMNADGSNVKRLTYRDDWPTDWWAARDR